MTATGPRITGLILAGGEGRRMGGADKGLLEAGGVPLIVKAAGRLRPQVGSIIVSANRNLDRYRALGFETVTDSLADSDRSAGPLAGVLAGLERCSTEWLACVPCDSPAFPSDLVPRLLAAAEAADSPAAFVTTPTGPHPVFMLLRGSLLCSLRRFLDDGGRRIREWQDRAGAVAVQFADDAAFANLNAPEDLLALNEGSSTVNHSAGSQQ